MLDNLTIAITGGTGSFGRAFCASVLENFSVNKLIIYSRDEMKQFEMQQVPLFKKNDARMRYFIGDVRDKERFQLALRTGVDVVIHAAALKQVPTAEYNPFEAVKTNIIGGQNVIDSCIESSVEKVVALSTDKAAAPVNLYGATKLASDKLFIAANNYQGGPTKLSVVRYGNVFGSRGSVVPFFLEKRKTGVLPITDVAMTRFSITLSQGVDFVLKSLERMWGGEVFVPKIPSYRLVDLAQAIGPDCGSEVIGIRPGEKLHEEMITKDDSLNTIEYSEHYRILPDSEYLPWSRQRYIIEAEKNQARKCVAGFSYNSGSNEEFLTVSDLSELVDTIA